MAQTATTAETTAEEQARDERVRAYELLYLVPNKYTEDEIPQIQQNVKDLIEKAGGNVAKEVNYGKRRLAYPVKHHHYGYYLLNHFEADASKLKELESGLNVQDEIIRYLISFAISENALPKEAGDLRVQETQEPKKEEVKEEPKKQTITDTKATDEEKQKMAKGTAFDLEKELGVTAKEAEESLGTEGKEKSKSDDSVDLGQLDTKLDEIMDDLDQQT